LHSFEEFNKKGDSLLGANEDIMDQTYPLGWLFIGCLF
jgi:hypothetical protein